MVLPMDLRLALMLVSDAFLAVTALFMAAWLRFDSVQFPVDWQGCRVYLVFVVVALFSSYLMEVYSLPGQSRKREIFVTCLQTGGAAFFLIAVVDYVEPSVLLGRGVLFFALAFFILFQFTWHAVSASGSRRNFGYRVLILGTGELACQLGGLLISRSGPYDLAGYLECDEQPPASLPGAPRSPILQAQLIKKDADLLQIARSHKVTMIVVALAERRGALPLQEMMHCKLDGVEVLDAQTFYELVLGKLMLEQMTPSSIIFSSGFRRSVLMNAYKRCFDICLSIAMLLISLPFFPLIALAIKLDSPGPLFFKQVRVGNGEKPFVLFKFRSMRQDAERNGAVWAVKNDARITGAGRFLRNSRIDELPQLYNVLKGEMSFIGPRPERPEFVEGLKRDIHYYSKRHTIKPGLTGWAQVRYPYGATREDAVEKLRYDLYYIKNLSPLLDTLIMFETMKVVLFGRGR